MVNTIGSVSGDTSTVGLLSSSPRLIPRDLRIEKSEDTVSFGKGETISTEQAMNMVVERSMAKLRAVVDQARADLGMSDDTDVDTSPEATANRIADFALGFFGQYAQNNGLSDDEEGRQQYADFIGGAIQQGIGEARDILQSLSALNSNISDNIDNTWEIVQQRLTDFVKNGTQPQV